MANYGKDCVKMSINLPHVMKHYVQLSLNSWVRHLISKIFVVFTFVMAILLYTNWSRCLHCDLMIPCMCTICLEIALAKGHLFARCIAKLDILQACNALWCLELKWRSGNGATFFCLSFCCYVICGQSQGFLSYSGTAVPRQDVACGTCNILLVDIHVISRALSTLFKCLKLTCCYLM